jgi:hypothetical protein
VASSGAALWAEHLPSPWQCTHVLVVTNKAPEVERAHADGRCVVTDYWLEACVKKGELQPTSIPGFEKLLCVPSRWPAFMPLPRTVDAWTHQRAECEARSAAWLHSDIATPNEAFSTVRSCFYTKLLGRRR